LVEKLQSQLTFFRSEANLYQEENARLTKKVSIKEASMVDIAIGEAPEQLS